MKKLSDIAFVQSGLVLSRKEAKNNLQKTYPYKRLNLRSICEDGSIDDSALDSYQASEVLERQFITNENDIVMRLFPPLCSVLIDKNHINLVVPSQLSVIRIKSKAVNPIFLHFFLSQDTVLKKLAQEASGTVSRGIKISTISNLSISLPNIQKQTTVASTWITHQCRKKQYIELLEQYDIQTSAVIRKAIGGKNQ